MTKFKPATILAIETSCDDTAISIIKRSTGQENKSSAAVLAQAVSSQTAIHAHWGGVVPHLAKREHSRNLVPLLQAVLAEAKLPTSQAPAWSMADIKSILDRNPDLAKSLIPWLSTNPRPAIEAIAVTAGPGLEPALWTGLNLAKTLSLAWQVPVIPINHLLGHIAFPLLSNQSVVWPALALIVSGGHTELIKADNWQNLDIIGQTKDDAAGEAFDKVARLLDLPYPGGPAIAKLAEQYQPNQVADWHLPRPMLNSGDYDFSFSGLKTAVRYGLDQRPIKTMADKQALAYEFQQAVIEVLVTKARRAILAYNLPTLIVGGGVAANQALRQAITAEAKPLGLNLHWPPVELSTDNATMIGLAALALDQPVYYPPEPTALAQLSADGHLSLAAKN